MKSLVTSTKSTNSAQWNAERNMHLMIANLIDVLIISQQCHTNTASHKSSLSFDLHNMPVRMMQPATDPLALLQERRKLQSSALSTKNQAKLCPSRR